MNGIAHKGELHRSEAAGRLDLVKEGSVAGLRKGWQGFVWMLKLLIPISLLTALLQWSGWLAHIDFLIQPAMSMLSLPSTAALPLLIGMLTGIYGGIAAMVVLPFTTDQMTLMAIFLLISHNMIQEGVIQGESGLHPFKATIFRIAASVVTVIAVAHFLDTSTDVRDAAASAVLNADPLATMLRNWSLATLRLTVKVFAIIMCLLTSLEILKALGWIEHIVYLFTPVLKMLGLSRRVGILWMTAVVFGLAYGAAVIVEEAKKGDLTRKELEELHLSIGINHSMVEDPSLFLALGLGAFWLWIPRLITAVAAVYLYRLWHVSRGRKEGKYGNKTEEQNLT